MKFSSCKKLFNFLTILIITIILHSQYGLAQKMSYGKAEKKAKAHFVDEVYRSALPLFLQLDSMKPNNINTNYKIGICYLHTATKSKAIPYFEKVKELDTKKTFNEIGYYLGHAYQYNHEFDKAITTYTEYKTLLSPKGDYSGDVISQINKYIENCNTGKRLVANPVKVNITHLNRDVNTKDPETYPVISYDQNQLFFSSKRKETKGGLIDEAKDQYYEDIYVVNYSNGKWVAPAVNVVHAANSVKHDAPLSVTKDGNRLYFYSTDKTDATDIFYSDLVGGVWSSPKNLGKKINSLGGETGAAISADGKRFYFSSDRPGGLGGMDLWYCSLQDNNQWSSPKNMGSRLNTIHNEETPTILGDGKTLFFSSDGPHSIGGHDIFKTIFNDADSSWAAPVNIGYPINSAEQEFHISWTPDGKKGYYSTFRDDTYGEEDIYEVEIIQEQVKEIVVAAADTVVEKSFIELPKPKTGAVLKDIVYFDFNNWSNIAEFSERKLEHTLLMLNTYPDLKIEIRGHTDNVGDLEGNKMVSDRRAKTLHDYFISKGIDKNRLVTKGYAFEQLLVNGTTTLENAQNRRVDFRALNDAEFAAAKVAEAAAAAAAKVPATAPVKK